MILTNPIIMVVLRVRVKLLWTKSKKSNKMNNIRLKLNEFQSRFNLIIVGNIPTQQIVH